MGCVRFLSMWKFLFVWYFFGIRILDWFDLGCSARVFYFRVSAKGKPRLAMIGFLVVGVGDGILVKQPMTQLSNAPICNPTHVQAFTALAGLAIVLFLTLLLPNLVRRLRGDPPRFVKGICNHCGYCLKGLPTPICPECGTDSSVISYAAAPPSRFIVWSVALGWVGFILFLDRYWGFKLDEYMLRVLTGIGEWSATEGFATPSFVAEFHKACFLRRAMTGVVGLGGAGWILWRYRRALLMARRAWQMRSV